MTSRLPLVAVLALLTAPVAAQEVHIAHCLHGCPEGAPSSNDTVIREIYVLSNNGTRRFADWVAFRVMRDTIGPTQDRTWKADPFLADDETLEPPDYDGAHAALGTDRGHQVPLAAFTGTPYWRQTNILSNITPQKSALNRGPWQRLEAAVRALAREISPVYVVTGPLYETPMPVLPGADEPNVVPSGYWKIVAIEEDGIAQVIAFIMRQDTPRRSDVCEHMVDVRTIERRTGLDFFPKLSRPRQDALEVDNETLAARMGC